MNSCGVCSLLVRHLAVNANNSIRSTGVRLSVRLRPQCARPACMRLGQNVPNLLPSVHGHSVRPVSLRHRRAGVVASVPRQQPRKRHHNRCYLRGRRRRFQRRQRRGPYLLQRSMAFRFLPRGLDVRAGRRCRQHTQSFGCGVRLRSRRCRHHRRYGGAAGAAKAAGAAAASAAQASGARAGSYVGRGAVASVQNAEKHNISGGDGGGTEKKKCNREEGGRAAVALLMAAQFPLADMPLCSEWPTRPLFGTLLQARYERQSDWTLSHTQESRGLP